MNHSGTIPDSSQLGAFFYAAGLLDSAEREQFEWSLERDPAVLDYTRRVLDLTTDWLLQRMDSSPRPSEAVKQRTLAAIDAAIGREQLLSDLAGESADGIVITDKHGLVRWVNCAFSLMCGYGLGELRGKKPGAVLQGPQSDAAAIARMRQAVRSAQPCREELINYHKNGSCYHVSIGINPILDSTGATRGFLAFERVLPSLRR